MKWSLSADWPIFIRLTGKVRKGLCRDRAVDESLFFFFFGLFVIYTCLCCEPNLYLKS